MKTIGVLALQGAVIEHLAMLAKLPDVKPLSVKSRVQLAEVDGLIIPGGESTAIGKLLEDFDLLNPLQQRIKAGMPVWGTCAGMILLAKGISDQEKVFLDVMDIRVKRNGYGGQLDSFMTRLAIPEVSRAEVPLVFIRAPYVEEAWGNVQVLAEVDGKIVACRQNHMLATAFHPELTEDLAFHHYFVEEMVKPMAVNAGNCT